MTVRSPVELVTLKGVRVGNQITLADGTVLPISDPTLGIAAGDVLGQASTNKFGRSTNVDNGIITDIWDRANVTNDQDIWLAPTAPRIHTIASNSVNDVGGGTGANSVRIFYLPNWQTAEATEIVTGNLNAGIAMLNAAVMINRMEVIPQATSTSTNVGTITATAAGDAIVTAQIQPLAGQTQMAIYGLPSIQTGYIGRFYGNVNKSGGATGAVDTSLRVNPNPNLQVLAFLIKHTFGIITSGTSALTINYYVPKKIPGPAIVKVQGVGSADNLDVSAGFDLVLVDN